MERPAVLLPLDSSVPGAFIPRPPPQTVTVRATSVANGTSFAQSTVTVTNPAPSVIVAIAPTTATLVTGTTRTFVATVTGTSNPAVTWSVNGVAGGSTTTGFITTGGFYTAPGSVPSPTTVTVRATSVVNAAAFGQTVVPIAAPPTPVAWLDGARFLEQSSFGPKPSSLGEVTTLGIPAYLDQQLAMPVTAIPAAA